LGKPCLGGLYRIDTGNQQAAAKRKTLFHPFPARREARASCAPRARRRSIENGLRGRFLLTFGEDARLIRLRHAAQNFSFLFRAALNLLRADKSRSIRLPGKLETAAASWPNATCWNWKNAPPDKASKK
jgi:hypothetical protein